MTPSGTMTAAPPLPPAIAAQQQASPTPMFAQMATAGGAGIPDPLSILEQKLSELEAWAASTAPILTQVNPALATLMVPIAQAGKAMQMEVMQMKQQSAGPSPRVAGSTGPAVPDNIPTARPGM